MAPKSNATLYNLKAALNEFDATPATANRQKDALAACLTTAIPRYLASGCNLTNDEEKALREALDAREWELHVKVRSTRRCGPWVGERSLSSIHTLEFNVRWADTPAIGGEAPLRFSQPGTSVGLASAQAASKVINEAFAIPTSRRSEHILMLKTARRCVCWRNSAFPTKGRLERTNTSKATSWMKQSTACSVRIGWPSDRTQPRAAASAAKKFS